MAKINGKKNDEKNSEDLIKKYNWASDIRSYIDSYAEHLEELYDMVEDEYSEDELYDMVEDYIVYSQSDIWSDDIKDMVKKIGLNETIKLLQKHNNNVDKTLIEAMVNNVAE